MQEGRTAEPPSGAAMVQGHVVTAQSGQGLREGREGQRGLGDFIH